MESACLKLLGVGKFPLGLRVSGIMLAGLASNIRPEFFDHAGYGVPCHLGPPDAHSVSKRAVPYGMICVGDTCGYHAAEDFRKIELCMPRVTKGNELPAQRIAAALKESSLAQLVVAGILMKQRWEDSAGPEVFDRIVGKIGPITLPIARCSLTITGLAVLCLTNGSKKSYERIFDIVKRRPD